MDKQKYLLEKKKINFTEKFIKKGLNAASYILFSLKEQGKLLLGELPSSYPQFKLLKEVFGVKEGDLNLTRKRTNFKENTIRVNLSRLKKQGLIRQELKKKIYVLTEEGKDLISYIGDRYSILNKPWDKKLRIVIFDIPEKKNIGENGFANNFFCSNSNNFKRVFILANIHYQKVFIKK